MQRARRKGADAPRVALTPSGARVRSMARGPVLELTEQGFYDVRTQGAATDAPMASRATSIWRNRT